MNNKKKSLDPTLEWSYRKLAYFVAAYLKKTHLTGTHITLIRIPIALLIFYLLLNTEYFFTAGLLTIVWKFLDKLDGALAVLKSNVTVFGGDLDTLLDRLFMGFLFFSLAWISYKQTQAVFPLLLLFGIIFSQFIILNLMVVGDKKKSLKSWNKRANNLNNINHHVYNTVFTIYYLPEQLIAFSLILNKSFISIWNINLLLYLYIGYTAFYISSALIILWLHLHAAYNNR